MDTYMKYNKFKNEIPYIPLSTELEAHRIARSEHRAKVALFIVFLLITACVVATGVLHAIE
jgi:hypothetical protein